MRLALRRVAVLVVASVLGAGGCAIGPDESPRDIDSDAIGDLPLSPEAGGAAATGAGRIYLLEPGSTVNSGSAGELRAVAREVGTDARALLEALLGGPNSDELQDQFRSAIPPELRLLGVRRRAAGVLLVDVSDEITELSGDELIAAVAQIVFTASELPDVRRVVLAVDGAPGQWPTGNGELHTEPLTVYDYPGLEPNGQPAYPGLPT